MWNVYDIAYCTGLALSSPYWLLRESSRKKVATAFDQRMGYDLPQRKANGPCMLIHAVSVGEINATRALIQKLREMHPGLRFVISTTTETGYTRASELYPPAAQDVSIIRYPLDFSSAIRRALDAVRPDIVVLMELEVWPNFMKRCQERDIPVVLANARLTSSSFRNYKWIKPIARKMFSRLSLICAQDLTYAERFLQLGVPPHRVVITGTMKFDNASFAPPLPAARHRAQNMLGLNIDQDPIWVCGSTGPGEERLILRAYRQLLRKFARLRLVIVPRHPPRFDEVQRVIESHHFQCVRLSHLAREPLPPESVLPPVVLIDAMGILRDFYAIATVVFVGRSLVDLGPRQHGSDMIEPAALSRPTVVGPYTSNFSEAMRKFEEADAILIAKDEDDLVQSITVLLSTPAEAEAMGARARAVVRAEQGATLRHARVILQILETHLSEDGTPAAVHPTRPAREASPVPAPLRPQTIAMPEPATMDPPPPIPPIHEPPPASRGKVVITSIGPAPPPPPR